MKTRERLGRGLGFGLALAAAVLLSTTAGALEAWDQEKVTALANELATAVREAKNATRKDVYLRDTVRMGDPVIVSYQESIDGIDKSARQLARRLGEGEGREQTLNIAKKIRSLVRDAETAGAKIMKTAWTEEKLQPAEDLLDQLAPYYFDE